MLAKTLRTFLLSTNLWWNIVMDDWNLDEVREKLLQHCKFTTLPDNIQGMACDVGLTFSVGDTTPQLTIIEQDNQNWWH